MGGGGDDELTSLKSSSQTGSLTSAILNCLHASPLVSARQASVGFKSGSKMHLGHTAFPQEQVDWCLNIEGVGSLAF